MTRKKEIEDASYLLNSNENYNTLRDRLMFQEGAKWADENPACSTEKINWKCIFFHKWIYSSKIDRECIKCKRKQWFDFQMSETWHNES